MKDEKVLLTLKIKKRHVLIFVLLLIGSLLVYSDYFLEYMTIPQTAAVMLTEANIDLNSKKILVIAPHCDDEVLGQGGVIKRTADESGQVKVVMVTDCNKHKIGSARKKESQEALAVLGVQNPIKFLDFAEGREHSANETSDLQEKLTKIIQDFQPDYLFVPNSRDTHNDHRWVGETFQKIDPSLRPKSKTYYYLIHYNFLKYPSPPGLKPETFLTPPVKLISVHTTWERLMLSTDEEEAKEEAILKYKSQLKITNPVLNRVLLDFVRKNELFMVEND